MHGESHLNKTDWRKGIQIESWSGYNNLTKAWLPDARFRYSMEVGYNTSSVFCCRVCQKAEILITNKIQAATDDQRHICIFFLREVESGISCKSFSSTIVATTRILVR